MSDNNIHLSARDARKLYWDVLASNLLFIVLILYLSIIFLPLWLQIIAAINVFSTVFHMTKVKKVLIKGELFPKKVKKDVGNKGS